MPAISGAGKFNAEITLRVSPKVMEAIQQMARDSGLPIEEVFTRAIALFQVSLQAISEGNHVGYASTDDHLDVEFTGLSVPEM